MISNNHVRSLASLGLIASLCVPSMASAAVATTNLRVNISNVLCTQLTTHVSDVQKRLSDEKAALDARRATRDQDLAKRRANRKDTVESKEKQALAAREQHANTLMELATTDAEKQAVTDFRATVNAAVQTRIDAVQAANDAYRKGLDAAMAARKTQSDAAVSKYTAAVQAAVERAKGDCASGTASATVRASLTASLKAAKDQFLADRLANDKTDGTVAQLAQTRDRAVAKARQAFVETMQKARADLRLAFGLEVNTDAAVSEPIPAGQE